MKNNSSPLTSHSGSSVDSDHPETPSDTDAHGTPLTRVSTGKSSRNQSDERTLTPGGFSAILGSPTGDGKRDAIPWPALNKLTPGNLKRTASHLMSEWEKSLTPIATPSGDSDAHTSDSGLDYGNSPPLSATAKFKKAD